MSGTACQPRAGSQDSLFISPGGLTQSIVFIADFKPGRNGYNRGKAVMCPGGHSQNAPRGIPRGRRQTESAKLQPELWRLRIRQGPHAAPENTEAASSTRVSGTGRCWITGIQAVSPVGRWKPIRLITELGGGKTTEYWRNSAPRDQEGEIGGLERSGDGLTAEAVFRAQIHIGDARSALLSDSAPRPTRRRILAFQRDQPVGDGVLGQPRD